MKENCSSQGRHDDLCADAGPSPRSPWRPEVRAFADLMEAQLRANDHKPGWSNDHPLDLLTRLRQEAGELGQELVGGSRTDHPTWQSKVGAEAADVANFAMMIADVCGALPDPSPSHELEALKALLKIAEEIDDYQNRPERGDPDHECACCMGELFDNGEREALTTARVAIAKAEGRSDGALGRQDEVVQSSGTNQTAEIATKTNPKPLGKAEA